MTGAPTSPQPQGPGVEGPAGRLELGKYFSLAWNLVTGDFVLLVLGWLVVAVIMGVPLVGLIVGGPLMFGYIRVMQRRIQGEPAAFGDLFGSFSDFGKAFVTMLLWIAAGFVVFVPIFIIVFILGLIPVLGALVALVSPLIFLAAWIFLMAVMFFVWEIAALSETDPVEAVKRSARFCFANLGPMLLLSLVVGLVSGAGVIACGVGQFFTVPIGLAAGLYAYNEYYLPKAQSGV